MNSSKLWKQKPVISRRRGFLSKYYPRFFLKFLSRFLLEILPQFLHQILKKFLTEFFPRYLSEFFLESIKRFDPGSLADFHRRFSQFISVFFLGVFLFPSEIFLILRLGTPGVLQDFVFLDSPVVQRISFRSSYRDFFQNFFGNIVGYPRRFSEKISGKIPARIRWATGPH